MTRGRGKKINPAKNDGSARDFAAGKKLGRPKQIWVLDTEFPYCRIGPPAINSAATDMGGQGHWEKVKRAA
jgi:hypothetical protein